MSAIRTRKHANNKYTKSRSGIWLRDPDSTGPVVEIESIVEESNYQVFLANESINRKSLRKKLDLSVLRWKNVAIVSDGYRFKDYLEAVKTCDVVISTHRTLARWPDEIAKPRFFLTNNPFAEAMGMLPKGNTKTTCIASIRTYPDFVQSYPDDVLFYRPAGDPILAGSPYDVGPRLCEYRNPICAALHLSHLVNAKSITVVSHDMAFSDNRPGSVEVNRGLYMYPSQIKAVQLIEDFGGLIGKKRSVEFVGATITS